MFNLAKVSPSIIAVDYLNQSTLQSSIKLVEKSGCKMLHLDVMDGKFVPNTTFSSLAHTLNAFLPIYST